MENKDIARSILRISLSLVFLYFGFSQIYSPDSWSSFVPEFVIPSGVTPNNIVILNGIMELSLGTFLLIGLYTKFASLVLSLHLFAIAFSIGFVPTGIRDFGLAFATLTIFLNGPDKYTLDQKMKK